MATATESPNLTPKFCFNQAQFRDFLRTSRSISDDTISQNLNALVTPSSQPFDPRSTSTRQPRKRVIDATACDQFKQNFLFPSWQSRSDALNYCARVATSPDPEDPDLVLRGTEDARTRESVVNERLDPYGSRYIPREARTEALASLIRNERMVEQIVRARTWGLVAERCGSEGRDVDEVLYEWRSRQMKDVEKERGDLVR